VHDQSSLVRQWFPLYSFVVGNLDSDAAFTTHEAISNQLSEFFDMLNNDATSLLISVVSDILKSGGRNFLSVVIISGSLFLKEKLGF
jgi:hypothetical protein